MNLKTSAPSNIHTDTFEIAVLLASCNGIRFIESQMQSIIAQQNVSITLFISDDMSVDGTWEYLQTIKSEQVILLPRKNKFGTPARNFFRLLRDVDFSEFDYVAFCDQDDIWLPDKFLNAIRNIRQRNVDAFSSNVESFWPDGKSCIIHKNQPLCEWDYLFESGGPGCTYVLSKRLALEIQKVLRSHDAFTDNIALHDWFVYCYARSHGYSWWIDCYPSVRYRQHDGNAFGSNSSFRSAYARWKMMRNGWYRDQVLHIANVCGFVNAWPIRRLLRYSWLDRFILAGSVHRFRRRWFDRLALSLMFLVIHGRASNDSE